MIEETIARIEAQLKNAASLSDQNRAELLDLLARLKSELTTLSKTNAEQARSIAGFTELTAHEATRQQQDEALLGHALDGLNTSVKGVELRHPQLTGIVSGLIQSLTNTGI